MTFSDFVKLCARSWSLRALALLATGTPGRLSPLTSAAGCNRNAMAASLERCVELKLIRRRTGHGHPLRPEFELTASGKRAGAAASELLALATTSDLAVLRRAWSLPVLVRTADATSFGAIRDALAPITDRALSQALKQLVATGLIERSVDAAAIPARTRYRLSTRGVKQAAAAEMLIQSTAG